MANNTKEKILNAALELFSEKGYSDTNLQNIADAVGIVKSALYRHYRSKDEIWQAIFDRMCVYYDDHFGSAEKLTDLPDSTDALFEMTMGMVNFTVHDQKIVKMRKIIMREQFRVEKVSKFATRYFIEDTKAIFEKVFAEMMDAGLIKKTDVGFLAFSYTAPITALIHLCDREPEQIPETIEKIEAFVKAFIQVYGVK